MPSQIMARTIPIRTNHQIDPLDTATAMRRATYARRRIFSDIVIAA
jgi:hypothetical protein